MSRWCLFLLMACLVVMATAGHGRRRPRPRNRFGNGRFPTPIGQSLNSYRDRERRFDAWLPFNDLESRLGSNPFLALFYQHMRPNPPFKKSWWQGPNICEKTTEDVINQTEAGHPIMVHFTTKDVHCDISEAAYKCVTEEKDAEQQRKTTVIYECCHGYTRNSRDFGCPQKMKLKNLIDTAKDLGLTEFLQAVDMLKLKEEFQRGNYTVFAPVNGAFGLDSDFISSIGNTKLLKSAPSSIQISEPALEKTLETLQGAIFGHMLEGSHRSSSLNNEQSLRTGHPEGSTIRINFFSLPSEMMTANCVPVVIRDKMATNGVIHTVETALKPVTDNLLDLVRGRQDLSMLKTVLSAAAYVPKLEEEGKYTLLAPTNDAFKKMNPRLRERLLKGDKRCIESVLLNHILPNVICSSVFQKDTYTSNHLKKQIHINRNEEDKLFVNDAQVVAKDIMAFNGVMHVIDDVLIPEEALGFLDVLEKKGFTELISLVDKAGLTDTLNSAKNVTLFAPTNEAIQNLPLAVKSKLQSDKDLLKKVLTYHASPSIVNTEHYRSNNLISTLEGRQVRLNRYTDNPFYTGVRTAQCAVIEGKSSKTCNGNLNVLSQVMIPPIGSVVDVLAADKRFSTLVTLLKKTDSVFALQEGGPFTVFAPNNKAFKALGNQTLENLLRNPARLSNLLMSHVYGENLCCAGILRQSWFGGQLLRFLSGTHHRVTRNRYGKATISHVPIVRCDRTASNGNILEIDQVLTGVSHPWRRRWNRRFNRNHRRKWKFEF